MCGVQVAAQRFAHDCAELFRVQSSGNALVLGWFEEGVAHPDKVVDARVETYAEPVPVLTRELDGFFVRSVFTCIDLEFLRERIAEFFVHQLPSQGWPGGANRGPSQTRCRPEKRCDRRIALLPAPAHHPEGEQAFLHREHRRSRRAAVLALPVRWVTMHPRAGL